ncbi:hypothetical protein SGRIM128S_00455 [Streptomyces griseomycini]
MQVVRHDVDVVQVLLDLEGLHAAQQVAGRGGGHGEHVVPAVGGSGPVELLAERLHQGGVALVEAGAAGVGDPVVQRVAGVLHRGGVLVVDVDAVEAVLPDELDRRVREGVDAGLVDRAVGVGGHRVEAAGVHPVAVVVEVTAGLGPTAHRDQRLDVGVLLLEFVQQVEVALVREVRVHLRAGHARPGHAGGRVGRAVRADGELVALVDVCERVVDVGDLVPGDVGRQIRGLPVLARAPAGEVADHPALVVGAHLLPPGRVVDRAVGDVGTRGPVQAVGTAGVLVGGVRDGGRQPGEQQARDGGGGGEQGGSRPGARGGRHSGFLSTEVGADLKRTRPQRQ